MRFSSLKLNKIEKFPETCGVYCFKDGKEFLYIGKAANIRERVKNHFLSFRSGSGQAAFKDNLFIPRTSRVGYIKTGSEIEALILEANLIKKYRPKFNIVWRDDKNYFFVAATKEDFPKIFITHQTKLKIEPRPKNLEWGEIEFVGPFVDGTALKQTLKVLRKIFPYRSCYKIPNRPCLWYHLERCFAPCLLKSPKESLRLPTGQAKIMGEIPIDSLKIRRICQKNAENLIKTLGEGENPVLKKLKKEMKAASKNQDFETAAKIRDQIKGLEKVMEHAKIFEPQSEKTNWPEIENKLKKILKTGEEISRIEAYDVSNIVGKLATGSMVAFINGLPDKSSYRKFKIKTPRQKFGGGPNDVAMIKEILKRRFKHPEWPYPDLILIDGGKAQLNVALKVKNQLRVLVRKPTPGVGKVMALVKKRSAAKFLTKPRSRAKLTSGLSRTELRPGSGLRFGAGENKLFIEGQRKPILLKNLPREIFNLILQLRDEAHRFARKYHLKLREVDTFG